MIFIGIGANLPSPQYGSPRATCGAALEVLSERDITVEACANWYRTAPVPVSDQPWYVNGVARISTDLGPLDLIGRMLDVEQTFGRERGELNAPRMIDLDLLTFGDQEVTGPSPSGSQIVVPHPRMHQRAFVLLPLRELAPDWRHPVSGRAISELIGELPAEQTGEVMAPGGGLFGTEWTGLPASAREA